VDLFQQGAAPESVFFLVDGLVKLVRVQPNGREAIVGLRSGHAVLGVASVLADEPHPVSATTVTRCRLVRVEAGLLRRRLREDPDLSLLIHRAQSAELNAHHVRVAGFCSLTAAERLEQFLGEFLELPGGDAGDGPRRIPLTQSEIASAVGVSPQYLCRLLHQFAADGSVRWERNGLVLNQHLR
jgi:CRP-like cAMP-binding protein